MSERGGNKDGRVAHVVAFLLHWQGAKVPEAMRAVKFTLKESLDTTKQMAIHRTYAKAIGGKTKSPFSVSVDAAANTLSLLPLTEPTPTARTSVSQLEMTPSPRPASDGDSIVRKPKLRQIRKTASGMQKWRVNKFDPSHHEKHAFKRATSWYAKELEKSVMNASARGQKLE